MEFTASLLSSRVSEPRIQLNAVRALGFAERLRGFSSRCLQVALQTLCIHLADRLECSACRGKAGGSSHSAWFARQAAVMMEKGP